MRKCSLLLLFVLFVSFLHAQYSLGGKVTDSTYTGMTNVNVLLFRSLDSNLVKGGVTGPGGVFEFRDLVHGIYFIQCSHTGYEPLYIHQINTSSAAGSRVDLGVILISKTLTELERIKVMAKKPLFEQKLDRMVVNVASSITSTGSTVLDVLEKSPGVIVNRQAGSIAMNGKDGVQVMINGKITYMPADAVLQLLEGMTSNNVEVIELITTAPAKLDAGGNAGYINIVLKKSPDQGFNGSYTVTAAAFYGSAPAGSADFNYRKKRLNLFLNYSFSRLEQRQKVWNYRDVTFEDKNTYTTSISKRDPFQRNHNLRLGMDYQIDKKTTLGILAAGYNNKWKMKAENNSNSLVNGLPDTTVLIHNKEINQWKHAMGNINLQRRIDQSSEWSFNLDYLYYDDHNPVDYINDYYNGQFQFLFVTNTRSLKDTRIRILPVQLDYTKKISSKVNVEAGLKQVLSRFRNDIRVEILEADRWKADPELTGNFRLKENITAAYISGSYIPSEKNSFKAGLRYEHTYSNLGSDTEKDIVNRRYGNLFPTVYWSRKLNDNNSFNISYNRRINRPTFNNLAPFLIFNDPNSFISGNVSLQPSIADAIKIDYMIKRFVISAAYTYEDNTIANFQTEINVTANKQFLRAQNLVYTKSINATISLPTTITDWWTSQVNVVATWQKAKADYLEQPITVTQVNYNISGFQSFILPRDYAFELSGFYQSPALFGIGKSRPFGSLNFGVQKKWTRTSNSLRFGVDDIFSTLIFGTWLKAPAEGFESRTNLRMGRRIFKLTYSQSFGNKVLRNKRERITASEEERRRVD
ncbi:MAG: outer membrane beta-barrel family protein [Chitinophagaceae bacterium]